MSSSSRTSVTIIVLTLMASVVGGWVGVRYGLNKEPAPQQLDELLHHRLHLSSAQSEQLTALEREFATRRADLEGQMRAANRDIATAITGRHVYDSEARAAVDRLHRAMMELQEATIQHVLAMRAVLTPDQVKEFDQTIDRALTGTQP